MSPHNRRSKDGKSVGGLCIARGCAGKQDNGMTVRWLYWAVAVVRVFGWGRDCERKVTCKLVNCRPKC